MRKAVTSNVNPPRTKQKEKLLRIIDVKWGFLPYLRVAQNLVWNVALNSNFCLLVQQNN